MMPVPPLGGATGVRVDAGLDPRDTSRHQRRRGTRRRRRTEHAGGTARGRGGAAASSRRATRSLPQRLVGRPRWRWRPSRPRSPRCAVRCSARRSPRTASMQAMAPDRCPPGGRCRRGRRDRASASPSRSWRVGDRAVAASGWYGTIAEIDEDRGRATLQVSGMRVDVKLDELQPAAAGRRLRSAARRPPAPRAVAGATSGKSHAPAYATGAASAKATAASHSTRARALPPALTCAALASMRRWRCSISTSTMPSTRTPAGSPSSTGTARERCVTPSGRLLNGHPLVRDWRPGRSGRRRRRRHRRLALGSEPERSGWRIACAVLADVVHATPRHRGRGGRRHGGCRRGHGADVGFGVGAGVAPVSAPGSAWVSASWSASGWAWVSWSAPASVSASASAQRTVAPSLGRQRRLGARDRSGLGLGLASLGRPSHDLVGANGPPQECAVGLVVGLEEVGRVGALAGGHVGAHADTVTGPLDPAL